MSLKLSPALVSASFAFVLLLALARCNNAGGLQQAQLASNPEGSSDAHQHPFESESASQIGNVIDTRATYLLSVFQQNPDAMVAAQAHQRAIVARYTQLQRRLGLFQGKPEAFRDLVNLQAELTAIELTLYWLENPIEAHTKASIPLNQEIHVEGVVDRYYE